MADQAHNTAAECWATTYGQYTELNFYLLQCPPQKRDEAQRELVALQDELLDTPAPTLTAVQQKLEILWDGKMQGLDQASEERRLILEDLQGLIQAQRQLLGV